MESAVVNPGEKPLKKALRAQQRVDEKNDESIGLKTLLTLGAPRQELTSTDRWQRVPQRASSPHAIYGRDAVLPIACQETVVRW